MEHRFKVIKSFSNPLFKELKKLSDPKKRKKLKKFLLEGFSFLKDAIENKTLYPLECVIIREDLLQEEKTKSLLESIDKNKIKCVVFLEELYNSLSSLKTPQGVMGVFKEKSFNLPDIELTSFVVILDEIRDPSNVGAIIRSAVAFGASAVFFSKATADPFSEKVLRASAGSLLFIPVVKVENPNELTDFLKNKGFKLVATSLQTETYTTDVKLPNKSAIILGNEASGIAWFWMQKADLIVKIPLSGKVQSLNVAVAAGIIFYLVANCS